MDDGLVPPSDDLDMLTAEPEALGAVRNLAADSDMGDVAANQPEDLNDAAGPAEDLGHMGTSEDVDNGMSTITGVSSVPHSPGKLSTVSAVREEEYEGITGRRAGLVLPRYDTLRLGDYGYYLLADICQLRHETTRPAY